MTKEEKLEKLKQVRKEYTRVETQYNKEYNPTKKRSIKRKINTFR